MVGGIKIIVKCPVCSWRLMDKVTPTSGHICIKCPHCHQIVQVNLSPAQRRVRMSESASGQDAPTRKDHLRQ